MYDTVEGVRSGDNSAQVWEERSFWHARFFVGEKHGFRILPRFFMRPYFLPLCLLSVLRLPIIIIGNA